MSEDPIELAIQAERARCIALLELYRRDMEAGGLDSLWCRIRNQIAMGIEVGGASFESQLGEDHNEESLE